MRDLDKGKETADSIRCGTAPLDAMRLDLADLDSIRRFAQEFRSRHDHLHVLMNNAGIMMPNRFYHRQFLTRKAAGNDLLSRFETLLETHYGTDQAPRLPTVQHLAGSLRVSPDYLGDLLRTLTGRNIQQHNHRHNGSTGGRPDLVWMPDHAER